MASSMRVVVLYICILRIALSVSQAAGSESETIMPSLGERWAAIKERVAAQNDLPPTWGNMPAAAKVTQYLPDDLTEAEFIAKGARYDNAVANQERICQRVTIARADAARTSGGGGGDGGGCGRPLVMDMDLDTIPAPALPKPPQQPIQIPDQNVFDNRNTPVQTRITGDVNAQVFTGNVNADKLLISDKQITKMMDSIVRDSMGDAPNPKDLLEFKRESFQIINLDGRKKNKVRIDVKDLDTGAIIAAKGKTPEKALQNGIDALKPQRIEFAERLQTQFDAKVAKMEKEIVTEFEQQLAKKSVTERGKVDDTIIGDSVKTDSNSSSLPSKKCDQRGDTDTDPNTMDKDKDSEDKDDNDKKLKTNKDTAIVTAGAILAGGGAFAGYSVVEDYVKDPKRNFTAQEQNAAMDHAKAAGTLSVVGGALAVGACGGWTIPGAASTICAIGGGSVCLGLGACFAVPFGVTVCCGYLGHYDYVTRVIYRHERQNRITSTKKQESSSRQAMNATIDDDDDESTSSEGPPIMPFRRKRQKR